MTVKNSSCIDQQERIQAIFITLWQVEDVIQS